MTERFSPEYIAYILSDEASVLQPRFFEEGDWAFLDRKPRLVKLVDREARVLIGSAWYGMENLKWLPSLTDLLDMIEEAGWAWGRNTDGEWYTWPVDSARIGYRARSKKDHPLAAAKLAVRVLEEGKDAKRNTT